MFWRLLFYRIEKQFKMLLVKNIIGGFLLNISCFFISFGLMFKDYIKKLRYPNTAFLIHNNEILKIDYIFNNTKYSLLLPYNYKKYSYNHKITWNDMDITQQKGIKYYLSHSKKHIKSPLVVKINGAKFHHNTQLKNKHLKDYFTKSIEE